MDFSLLAYDEVKFNSARPLYVLRLVKYQSIIQI